MDTKKDTTFVRRHTSQLKVLARLIEHELDGGQGKDIVLDRELAENILDTLEIFIEDVDGSTRERGPKDGRQQPEKAAVTRLN
jgi:hypothetical protein